MVKVFTNEEVTYLQKDKTEKLSEERFEQHIKDRVKGLEKKPSKKTINAILAYSQSLGR